MSLVEVTRNLKMYTMSVWLKAALTKLLICMYNNICLARFVKARSFVPSRQSKISIWFSWHGRHRCSTSWAQCRQPFWQCLPWSPFKQTAQTGWSLAHRLWFNCLFGWPALATLWAWRENCITARDLTRTNTQLLFLHCYLGWNVLMDWSLVVALVFSFLCRI